MSVSRDRLAPGQSRVSTASAFGRIGLLLAAAVLTIPAHPVPAEAGTRAAIEAPPLLSCLAFEPQVERCGDGSGRAPGGN